MLGLAQWRCSPEEVGPVGYEGLPYGMIIQKPLRDKWQICPHVPLGVMPLTDFIRRFEVDGPFEILSCLSDGSLQRSG